MQPAGFSRTYAIKWADLDTNGHLRYSVYVDVAVDTQFRSIESYGYTPKKLMELGFGPVILRMETGYQREVTFDDSVTDSFRFVQICRDVSRWRPVEDTSRYR